MTDGTDLQSILALAIEDFCKTAVYALENLPYLVNIISMPDYRVIFVNRSMREYLASLGYEVTEESLGKPAWEIFPSWSGAFYKAFQEAYETNRVTRTRDLIHCIDGRPTYWDLALVPNTDVSGEVTSITSIRINMTERREAEDALAASEERFRMMAETATDVIISIDEQSKILYVNSAAETVFGYKPEELIGEDLQILIPEEKRQAQAEEMAEYVKSGDHPPLRTGLEIDGLRKDGQHVPLEVSYGHFVKNGQHVFVGIARDITERKKYMEERERLLHENHERLKELSCLYQISQFGQAEQFSINEVLQKSAELLPLAYQYPEIAVARIEYARRVYETPNFRPTQWMQSTDIIVNEKKAGSITVAYLEERPAAYEGPFLREERYMLDAVAKNLGSIFEREQAEAEFRKSEANFRSMFEFLPAAIMAYNKDGLIQQVNPAFERLYGYPRDQIIGRHISETIGRPENRPRTMEIATRVFAGESFENIEWENIRSDGTPVYVLSSITPIYDASGNVDMTISFAIDITERKLAEQRKSELAAHKREFYRQTIFAATEGKLVVTDRTEISKLGRKCLQSWEIRDRQDIGKIRTDVIRLASEQAMDPNCIDDFIQCVGESSTNAYKHGGGGIASLYTVEDGLLFIVSDKGPGIEAVALPELALKRGYTTAVSLGMGFKMMIALADRLYLATGPSGTTVAIEMKLHPEKTAPPDALLAAAPIAW